MTTVFPGFIRDAGHVRRQRRRSCPRGVGTRTPEDVAQRGDRGHRASNRAEIDVAPLSLAFGARLFGLAPGLMAGVNRRLGSDPLAEAIAAGQRDKR